MKVFKFGGASVKDAESIRNVGNIISAHATEQLMIVVSAMHKTTNALEEVMTLAHNGQSFDEQLKGIIDYHLQIISALFPENSALASSLKKHEDTIRKHLNNSKNFDITYDQVVSLGEIISSEILSAYLNEAGIANHLIDAREFIFTDLNYREGKVDWDITRKRMQSLIPKLNHNTLVTQGFIGRNEEGRTTTLGREGSDYTAAIFGACLNAESVTIWKDVPGVMSADPKRIPTATTFDELPFKEAAEMTYYGASVIHPKTIKPLANLGIPLLVKNFSNTTLPGTTIHEVKVEKLPPLIVFKENQCLISCHVTDYTFVDESQISIIFSALASHRLKINLMQNSAISFSFCLDFKTPKVMELIKELSNSFEVYYNTGLTLITIKNYDTESFDKYRKQNGVILEQSSRSTLQVLIKS